MTDKYDMAVIGGGPGGYVAALRGRQLGLEVVLVEKERIGGVCLNRGCIPTKALLADVDGLRWARRAAADGIISEVPAVNFGRLMDRKAQVVHGLVTNLEKWLAATGVEVVAGRATIPEPGVVLTEDGRKISARGIVIATGSRQRPIPIPGVELPGVLGTRQMLNLKQVPQRLVVIGGGIIGQEFASIYAPLGSKVTILEALDRILNEVDLELARKYASLLPGQGISVETGVNVTTIDNFGSSLRVAYEKKSREKVVEADLVLIAAGRGPYTDGLGLDKLGVAMERGAVSVNRRLCTSVQGIYAVGDVTGRKMLAHVASYHGEIAAENISGIETLSEDDIVPSCVFTHPQIAWVGPTEEQVAASGRGFRTAVFSLSANGKALAMGEARGWVKLIEDSEEGVLLGAHLMGPDVSELIGELSLAVRKRLSAKDVADTIHAHPTLSEAVREAALGLLGGSIHAASRVKSFGRRPI
ncbi:MAG: dihydrolipoyl dehydrogenase [Desulfomonile tiedjei]|uniref:Dihydrolipoyl dehydrogenase n=1 Tax=Desulfomonile tiedjei TaxID=2358 RepID=A0A9D6Z276_9BACT|nr:dihydrolipoyl dehydrogenase [Desulfomonile tiedjei]